MITNLGSLYFDVLTIIFSFLGANQLLLNKQINKYFYKTSDDKRCFTKNSCLKININDFDKIQQVKYLYNVAINGCFADDNPTFLNVLKNLDIHNTLTLNLSHFNCGFICKIINVVYENKTIQIKYASRNIEYIDYNFNLIYRTCIYDYNTDRHATASKIMYDLEICGLRSYDYADCSIKLNRIKS